MAFTPTVKNSTDNFEKPYITLRLCSVIFHSPPPKKIRQLPTFLSYCLKPISKNFKYTL